MLSEGDIRLLGACMMQTADSKLYEDAAFMTLFGVDRNELHMYGKVVRDEGRFGRYESLAFGTVERLLNFVPDGAPRRMFITELGASDARLERILVALRAQTSGGAS